MIFNHYTQAMAGDVINAVTPKPDGLVGYGIVAGQSYLVTATSIDKYSEAIDTITRWDGRVIPLLACGSVMVELNP